MIMRKAASRRIQSDLPPACRLWAHRVELETFRLWSLEFEDKSVSLAAEEMNEMNEASGMRWWDVAAGLARNDGDHCE